MTHKYGAQNGCFDDPPQSVVNHIPASVRSDEKARRPWHGRKKRKQKRPKTFADFFCPRVFTTTTFQATFHLLLSRRSGTQTHPGSFK